MSSYSRSYPGDPGPSTSKRRRVETFEPETAHERHQRLYRLKSAYERGKVPAKPQSRNELDVLKERHQFVRDSNVDPASLAWEDQLAYKYYETLFKEFALVNLKHYKSGAVALRWRTEDEVLSGIGHLTCASLRCAYHEPSPAILAALEEDADVPPDPDSTTPLVEARLEEMQMPFGYVERGEKKTTLVKVVLCRECGKKLRYGRQKAKEEREKKILEASGGAERSRDERGSEPIAANVERAEQERRRRRRHADEEVERDRRRSRRDERGSSRRRTSSGAASEDYGPALPPELASSRSRTSPPARSPRPSASPLHRR